MCFDILKSLFPVPCRLYATLPSSTQLCLIGSFGAIFILLSSSGLTLTQMHNNSVSAHVKDGSLMPVAFWATGLGVG